MSVVFITDINDIEFNQQYSLSVNIADINIDETDTNNEYDLASIFIPNPSNKQSYLFVAFVQELILEQRYYNPHQRAPPIKNVV